MERKLEEITERLIRLDTAQEFRHKVLTDQATQTLMRLEHVQVLLRRVPPAPARNGNGRNGSGAWIKVPVALVLPSLVFFLILAITGDLKAAREVLRFLGPPV